MLAAVPQIDSRQCTPGNLGYVCLWQSREKRKKIAATRPEDIGMSAELTLLLVQHGDAVSKDVDPERPLSDQGHCDVAALADFLRRAGVRVEHVWHSGKRRAEQTAVTLAKAVMPADDVEAVFGIEPNDDVEAFAATLADQNQHICLVGHLPFLARLTSLLLTGHVDRELVMYRPGSVLCLERTLAGSWHLNWMVRPELLVQPAGPETARGDNE
jgi:phosphohistidine phosphatase